jgi:acyl carrier protein
MSLRKILIDVFSSSLIPEEIDNLKMGDLEEWDSLGNFNLILAIEQEYGIQFKMEDLENLTSIKEIKKSLNNDFSEK